MLKKILSNAEREEISRGIAVGESGRSIAVRLGRHSSVVHREIARHGGREEYRSHEAQKRSVEMSRRPRDAKIESNEPLLAYVNEGFAERWSPGQISQRMREDHPEDESMRISHESIYRALFFQARGALRVELSGQIRSGRSARVSRATRRAMIAGRQAIPQMTLIAERPPEVEDRAVPGHWEGDLIMGEGNKCAIITLVERSTRFVLLGRQAYDHTADRTALVLSQLMGSLPDMLKGSLTWDQGREMARHAKFTLATDIPVFFCDPHSPWQRGSNENTNGLLREYFPKGADLSGYTQGDLDEVARQLNGRPRQTLDWRKPIEKLNELLDQHGDALTT